MESSNKFVTQDIGKLYAFYVIPAIISMLITGSQSIIDSIFVGNFIGANAMSSVNIIQPFMSLIFAITFVITTGCISYIGRMFGQGRIKMGEDAFKTCWVVLCIVLVIVGILGITCNRYIAQILGASDLLIEDSSTYVFVISFFAPIIGTMILFAFNNRLINKPIWQLASNIISLVANIVMDYLFIAVWQMGITGAALATGLSYAVGLLIVMIPLLNKNNALSVFKGKINLKTILPICANGASEAVVSTSTALTVFLFNITLMKYAAESGVASFTIISNLGTFSTLLMFGVADGINAMVSYNYGSGKHARVKKILSVAIVNNLLTGIAVFLIFRFAGEYLISAFVDDADIIAMAYNGAKIYSFAFLILGVNLVVGGYFTAIGNALFSIIIALSRGIIFMLIGIFLLPMWLDLNGVWLTVPFAESCTIIIAFGLILWNKKKTKLLINEQ